MKTIGLIGAGHFGSQLSRLGVAHAYNVVVNNSRGPDDRRGRLNAKKTVTQILDEFGFDAVDAGPAQGSVGGASSATLQAMVRVGQRRNCAKTLRRRSGIGTSDDSLMEWHE